MIEVVLPPLQRVALYGGTLLLVGAAIWRLFILRRVAAHLATFEGDKGVVFEPSRGNARVARIAFWAALVLLPVWALRLYVQLLGFRDPFAPLRDDLDILVRQTTWGTVWLGQGVLLLMLVGLLWFLMKRETVLQSGGLERAVASPGALTPGWVVVGVGAVLLALTLGLSSHAMSAETRPMLALIADTSHTLAAGAWIGTLVMILATAPRAGEWKDPAFAAQLRIFSPLAMVAVGVLVGMGTYLSWQYLTALSDLWTTPYGRILGAKIAVAGLVMLTGAVNWRRGIPTIDTVETQGEVRRRATVEAAVVVFVLILTGVLTGTSQP